MDPSTVTHLHLLLNHVPTVGSVIGFGLFALALVRSHEDLKRASLEVFVLIALATVAVYVSGVAAQKMLTSQHAEVSTSAIQVHQDAALLAFVFMEITGFFAWVGLWQFRRLSQPTRATSLAIFAASAITLALMARAAYIGGQIRHPEIQAAQEAAAGAEAGASDSAWIKAASVQRFVDDTPWVWPTSETLHFIGLSLLFGILLTVNLRMLGFFNGLSFAAVHRLLPWAVLGYGVNLVTGMLFFIGMPDEYVDNDVFLWKIAFLMVAGANLLSLTVSREAWSVEAGDDPPFTVKAVAASSIFLWAGVMYCGRMLPFIGKAF